MTRSSLDPEGAVVHPATMKTGLTVNTALPPAPARKPPTTIKRTGSASSLVPSPTCSSGKRTSPRCTSPASTVDRSSSWLGTSPTARSTAGPATLPKPIPPELYFRLLKRSNVLDQLLEVSSHLETQEQQLRRLETDRAKNESVQSFVFQELDTYKRKFVEAQQFLLDVVEAMTVLSVKEEELQRGTGTKEAAALAQQTSEERVMQDLDMALADPASRGQVERSDKSIESSALRRVGLQRVDQLSSLCESYEQQLRKGEAELSRAMHSAYKDECLTKMKDYEEMQKDHSDELKALGAQIDNLKHQNTELHDVIDDQRDEIAQLKQQNQALRLSHDQQTASIEQFGSQLKAEIRKRYGLVPSVVDTRWHEFFPSCAAPE